MIAKHIRMAIGIAATLAATLAATAPALAAGPVTLNSDVKVDRLVDVGGRKQHVLAPAAKVVPGDRLVFATQYRNTSAKPVDNFVVTNPIPAGVRLADDGFGGFDASVDGGKVWGKLATLTTGDGKGGKRAAQAGDVTHLRWVIPAIAAGAGGVVEYHGVVR